MQGPSKIRSQKIAGISPTGKVPSEIEGFQPTGKVPSEIEGFQA